MSNPVATFAQHNHITEAYKTGAASYYVAALARELVAIYGADITGRQAIAAATDLSELGFITPQQIRNSHRTHELVTAAVNGAKAA